MVDGGIMCPKCQEVQSADNLRCARCGYTLETKEHREVRLATLEQERRESERNSVSIQRLPGFGTNGNRSGTFDARQYVANMSNHRKRRFVVLLVAVAIGFAFFWSH